MLAEVTLLQGDLSPEFENAVRRAGSVGWDIETTGLDFRLDTIATCQLHVPKVGTVIVRMETMPERLRDLLIDETVTKIFHHAPFDLRFMAFHWKAHPRNIACTKIAAKIAEPGRAADEYSLKALTSRYLQVEIDKSERVSDWLAADLRDSQIAYAATDVLHLHDLLEAISARARWSGTAELVEKSFVYIPTRVETDLLGCGDVFAY